jgi:hypothetical protein
VEGALDLHIEKFSPALVADGQGRPEGNPGEGVKSLGKNQGLSWREA